MNSEFLPKNKIKYLLTDIDDTLTDEGRLGPEAYQALWDLENKNIRVIPITGRPAGWCELIARVWPVSGVVGENGGFYFRYHNKKMIRHFYCDEETRLKNRLRLNEIQEKVLKLIPGTGLASDQFCRLMDTAIDFCEDVPRLPYSEVLKIVDIFTQQGAQAKVSSIHVNAWFGDYDKLTQTLYFLKNEFNINPDEAKKQCAFVGDSPNDEPMWAYFPNSFAVANINEFLHLIKNKPQSISSQSGGKGFVEIVQKFIS